MTDLRYPVGRLKMEDNLTEERRREFIEEIASAPGELRAAVEGLSDQQGDTQYRPDGWTVRQVVHHLVDSHLNSYIRFRLALTEDSPTIKPYDQEKWAQLEDAKNDPIETSLDLFESMHKRWVSLLSSLSPADFARTFSHPETGKNVTLDRNLCLYAWHGRHHIAHITSLREREGW